MLSEKKAVRPGAPAPDLIRLEDFADLHLIRKQLPVDVVLKLDHFHRLAADERLLGFRVAKHGLKLMPMGSRWLLEQEARRRLPAALVIVAGIVALAVG